MSKNDKRKEAPTTYISDRLFVQFGAVDTYIECEKSVFLRMRIYANRPKEKKRSANEKGTGKKTTISIFIHYIWFFFAYLCSKNRIDVACRSDSIFCVCVRANIRVCCVCVIERGGGESCDW